MTYLDTARRIIAQWEGRRNEPYYCSAGKLTVGYGHTGNVEDRRYSDEECENLLIGDIKRFDKSLDHMVKVPLSDNQRAALLSLVFNIGVTALSKSTLLRYLNAGKYKEAGEQFTRWRFANGKPIQGLLNRRRDEMRLWNGEDIQ